jgi:hypothetical protein
MICRGCGADVVRGYWFNAKCDLSWAFERLFRCGDYAPGGYFEREHGPLWVRG